MCNKILIFLVLSFLFFLNYYKYEQKYDCEYAGLWCSCYTNDKNGCSVSCSPAIYKTIYNQTSCPAFENFVLAGFNKSLGTEF